MIEDLKVMVSRWEETGHATVRDLLANASALGLPAFQRGAVWDGQQATRLLESLERDYFVGTLLLWLPDELPPGSVSIVPGTRPRILLLDGQQRVRALYEAFFPRAKGGVVDGDITCIGANTFWRGRRYKGDRSGDGLPIAVFRSEVDDDAPRLQYDYMDRPAGDGASARLRPTLRSLDDNSDWGAPPDARERAQRILNARIAIRLVRYPEREALDNYLRLNAGGRALAPEELDFAGMVGACPEGPSLWLDKCLGAWTDVRERTDSSEGEAGEESSTRMITLEARDSLLERGQDRHFGLKLLVRAMGIACDLAAGDTSRESARRLSADYLERFESLKELLGHAGAAVLALGETLRDDLFCDDRSRIPRNGAAFGVALALLIRFPELRSRANRAIMKPIVLGMLLGEMPKDAFRVVTRALGASPATRTLLNGLQAGLGDGRLAARIEKQRTSFGPQIDVLYWLLRRGGARDVPCPAEGGKVIGTHDPLSVASGATRQHIVPWSRVSPRPARTAEHWVNSLGNITWISGEANGLDGWGSTPMVFGGAAEGHHAAGFDAMLAELRAKGEAYLVNGEALLGVAERALVEGRAQQLGAAMQAWWDATLADGRVEPLREANQVAFPSQPSLRITLFDWWRNETLVDLVELAVFRMSWAPGTGNSTGWGPGEQHRASFLGRARGRRTWKGGLPESLSAGYFEVQLRWPGEDDRSPARVLRFSRALIVVPEGLDGAPGQSLDPRTSDGEARAIAIFNRMKETWPELQSSS